ncbi:serine palmitoyltransferase Lcb2 [Schizosaccharomyces pombe]|uniref:Serine palmitoyltransferase 2 n=1 Tax=Schizosaccharomyces pombe (strain 972 / ATCC 24843) TaxID=284812 RepID=LCB2_SCHPO|nr:putative serine palmitoyltransferase Lcb2 [Schizosaccharomyces pombe]Q09925.1 RecName: Full=Serine palmitoyltransferase 2; Short=SPT 2; AltName: Full=Long chain base biosynthesis protein 2 [Schizosaccharomyces pombe 972h-]AAC49534.1 serine palmitoyltransferase [Schizosaccharomyces pombe]CAA91967.3 serine palmitoyltransferase Lcb2 (predicted) [Schizosaccharomyces pombe]|eukprot:NP_001342802.1 putative serine palmitoyltransferase Lcb2 [Schizosaccharomyces pombe]
MAQADFVSPTSIDVSEKKEVEFHKKVDHVENPPLSTESAKLEAEEVAAEKLNSEHLLENEFAPITDPTHRRVSKNPDGAELFQFEDEPSYYYVVATYLTYLVLIIIGHVRDFFGKRFHKDDYKYLKDNDGYAPLYNHFDNFYVRRLQHRINDCFSRPTMGVPGRVIRLMNRYSTDSNSTFKLTGDTSLALNVSSYNYLGFAQSHGPCATKVEEAMQKYGLSTCSSNAICGTYGLHKEVEELTANFVGKPAALVFSQGFSTNATVFSTLMCPGSLIISDELNHTSIRFGARLSGANIRVYKHNDMTDLERVLREVISQGQPRTHRPYSKILVVIEGLYSMEGNFCDLPKVVELKNRYKFYLFIDEAHSIGAIGPRGGGICDYFGISTDHVDILMGTFTKSFGAAGGYISATPNIINKLRVTNPGYVYAESMSPAVLAQIKSSFLEIMDNSPTSAGLERIERLAFNSRYIRLGLKRLGFIIFGNDDSPVVPLLLYNPGKINAFSHEMLKRGIAVVVVGYPACPLLTSRVRFCFSASHNKADMDYFLRACDEVGEKLQLKFSTGAAGEDVGKTNVEKMKKNQGWFKPPRWKIEDVLKHGVHDALTQ